MTPASDAPAWLRAAYVAIAVAVAAAAVVGVHRATKKAGDPSRAPSATLVAALVAAVWIGASLGVAASGNLARFDARPPPFALVVVATLAGGLALGALRVGKLLADGLPFAAIVGFHAFRLPLELVMHETAKAGVMPLEMSFSGYNFDIVTGLTACLVAPLAATGRAPRWLLVGWNVLGSVLLAVIVTIAVLATPTVHAFGASVNTFVAHPPFVLLPTVMVLGALAGHVVMFRKLAATRS